MDDANQEVKHSVKDKISEAGVTEVSAEMEGSLPVADPTWHAEDGGRLEGTEGMEGTEGSLKEKTLQNFQKTHLSLPSTFSETVFRDFLLTKSQTQSILYLFFYYGEMTYEELGFRMEKTADQVSTIARKPSVKNKVEKKNDDRPAKYGLTEQCKLAITEELTTWHRLQFSAAEKLSIIMVQQEELEKKGEAIERAVQEWTLYLDYIDEKLVKRFNAGEYVIDLDFQELQQISLWLAQNVLDTPEDSFRSLVIAAEKKNYPRPTDDHVHYDVLLTNLPPSLKVSLRDLRTKDLDRLRWSLAEVEMISDVRPEMIKATFECPSCSNILVVLQSGDRFQEPTKCSCGRKGRFKLIRADRRDTAIAWVTEPLGEVLGSANTRTRVRTKLQGDVLTKRDLMRRLGPGVLVQITYLSKELQIILKSGGVSRTVDLELHIGGIEVMDNYRFTLDFTDEEIDSFEDMVALDNFLELLGESAYPDHYGDEHVKRSLLAQLVSGRFTERVEQETLHVFISGDPGVGKTRNFLMRSVTLAPIAHLSQATSSSTAGLLGSAGMKDPYTNRQMFEPGVLPRNSRGLVGIDEIGALDPEDHKALNECLAHGTCTIDKANIHQIAPADCRVLGAANPKAGRFDDTSVVNAEILGIEPSLLDRFDVIIILRDSPDKEKDRNIAERMIRRGTKGQAFSDERIRRFILYARDKIKPQLTEETEDELMNYYVRLRSMSVGGKLTISPRQLNSLRALTLCSAKLHLRETTTHDDVVFATEITEKMFRNIGYDVTNLQRSTPHPSEERVRTDKERIRDTIAILEKSKGKEIPVEEIITAAGTLVVQKDRIQDTLEAMLRTGELFRTTKGCVGRNT